MDRDHTSIVEHHRGLGGALLAGDLPSPSQVRFMRHVRPCTHRSAQLDDVAQTHPDAQRFRIDSVNVGITTIEEGETVICIEDAQSLMQLIQDMAKRFGIVSERQREARTFSDPRG